MKRLYFFNDWWARKPWYIRILIIFPFWVMYISTTSGKLLGYELSQPVEKTILAFLVLLSLAVVVRSIFKHTRKNIFLYGLHNDFSLKIGGTKTDFESRHISEVSLDENHLLQIRRINRVDSFDLSPFREKDREKLMKYLKEFLSDEVEMHSNHIPTT